MKANLFSRFTLMSVVLSAAAVSGVALAEDVPGHPRVNQVDNRLDNQQKRIEAGEANGTISHRQAARDEKRDARIARRANADEARHGGHLTKREQNHLNASLNKNSKHIHDQRHG